MPDRLTATATIMAIDGLRLPPDRFGDLMTRHGGRIVPSADGVLVAFDAASYAVEAASALQAEVARSSPDHVKVGITAGDVTWDGGECFGSSVVTAERLCAVATAGQILVTDAVRALAGDRAGVRFEHLGPVHLPGLATAADAFSVSWDRSPPTTRDGPGAPPMPLALAGTPGHSFVGRGDALVALNREWNDAAVGAGRLVLVGGEAGAGKTRLAAEFARRILTGGGAVLYGGCDDDLALPYQPWIQAFDPVLPTLLRDDDWLTVDLAPLSSLSVNVDRFVPVGSASVSPDPETERYRRYGAFARLLDAVADRWPTLVVLDDLHWAGSQTLALLRHLPRAGLPRGVMIVATFRDTGDEVSEPLASCLADLRRIDGARRLRLDGLDALSVERYVADAAGGVIDDGLRRVVRVLTERTDGNAFYVGELWRHLVAAGAVVKEDDRYVVRSERAAGDVPDSVREVVIARLGRLSSSARHTLETAAVAGQRVELTVLAAALEASDRPLDTAAAVDELVTAGLLSRNDGPPLSYQFCHAIVRDTVDASVPPSSKRHLHLAVAQALEVVHEADRRPVLAELARHFVAAAPLEPVERAVHYGRRAAIQAIGAAAYDEAVAHVHAVLALSPAPTERAELLNELGTALLRSGFYEASRSAYREAFELAAQLPHVDAAARAAIGFEVATHFPALPGGPAVELLEQAIALAADADPATRVRLRASFGRALAIAGRVDEGVAVAEAARAEARALDDPDSLTVAQQAIATAVSDPRRLLDETRELAALAARLGDTWSASYAAANSIRVFVQLGRPGEASEALDRLRALSASGRFSTFQFMAHALEALVELAAGRFDLAEAAAERAQAHGAVSGSPFADGVFGLQMFAIRRAQGRLAEVAPALGLLARRADAPPIWRPGLAALYTELGLLDEAAAVFASLAPDRFAAVARDSIWPACLTFLAETGLAVGGPSDLAVLHDELLAYRGVNLLAGFTMCYGPADRLLGAIATRLGRHDDAEAHFTAAMDLATRSESPVWAAEVQHDWAVALAARGEVARAAELDAEARATAHRIGMHALAARPIVSAGAPIVAAVRPDRLSEREIDVLRCVAAGLSNRQIGLRLYISQNTVANHVRSILQKTGCANRTEAAGYAVRQGLADVATVSNA